MEEAMLILIFVVYAILLGILTYVLFCANPNSKGWSGNFARFFIVVVPRYTRLFIRNVFGSSALAAFQGCLDYIMHQRNPLLIIAYLVVINGAFFGWLVDGAPKLPMLYVSDIHYYGGFIGVVVAQTSFFFACTVSPGRITKATVNRFNHQPYDGVLYTSGTFCKTCQAPKLARSKHCRMCGFCVPIFDHHCVWLNQCVGEQNHKHFLTFLVVNSGFFMYASYVISMVFISEIYEKNLFNVVFYNHVTGDEFKADYLIIGQYLIGRAPILFAVWLIAVVMAIAVSGFLAYHIYLLAQGTTTNETFKWDYVKKIHKELERSHLTYQAALRYGGIPKKMAEAATSPKAAEKAVAAGQKNKKAVSSKEEHEEEHEDASDASNEAEEEEDDVDHSEGQGVYQQVLKDKDNSDEFVGCMPTGFAFNEPEGYNRHFIREVMDTLEDSSRGHLPEYMEEPPGPLPRNIYKIGLFPSLWRVYFGATATKTSTRSQSTLQKKSD